MKLNVSIRDDDFLDELELGAAGYRLAIKLQPAPAVLAGPAIAISDVDMTAVGLAIAAIRQQRQTP